MSYSVYPPSSSYTVVNQPPMLYAYEQPLEGTHDSDVEDSTFDPGMWGGAMPASENSVGSLLGPGGIYLPPAQNKTTLVSKPSHKETEAYLRRNLGIPLPRPLNLWAIPDSRTPTISEMIKLAIWGSADKRLTLSQIREAIEERFPAKRNSQNKAWKNSIRHNLSFKKIFQKEPRPKGGSGQGGYWYLDIRHGETRRKRAQSKTNQGQPSSSELESVSTASTSITTLTSPQHEWYAVLPDTGIKTESPQPDFLVEPTGRIDRLGHLQSGGPSIYNGVVPQHHHHGYQHWRSVQPPRFPNFAINPRMTMGDHSPSEIGPSFLPLGRREDMTLPVVPEAPSMVMSMQPGPSRPLIQPNRRRTYAHSFGLEDKEGDERGTPKARRTK